MCTFCAHTRSRRGGALPARLAAGDAGFSHATPGTRTIRQGRFTTHPGGSLRPGGTPAGTRGAGAAAGWGRGRSPSAETGCGAGRGTQCGEATRGERGRGRPAAARVGWSRHTRKALGRERAGSRPLRPSGSPGRRGRAPAGAAGTKAAPAPPGPPRPPPCRALPDTLHLPGPRGGGGGPACSSLSAGSRDAKELVGPGVGVGAGVRSAHAGVAVPAAGREAPRPAGPVLLGGSSLPAPLSTPGRAGTPHHYTPQQLPALPGQGGGGRAAAKPAGTAKWGRGWREAIANPVRGPRPWGRGGCAGGRVSFPRVGPPQGHPEPRGRPGTPAGGEADGVGLSSCLGRGLRGPQHTMTPLRSRGAGGGTQGGGGRSDSSVTPGFNPCYLYPAEGGRSAHRRPLRKRG